jgi:hypothetical protein
VVGGSVAVGWDRFEIAKKKPAFDAIDLFDSGTGRQIRQKQLSLGLAT